MDDYWLDAAHPRRRNWWELDQDNEDESPYQPVGLEAFHPDPPTTLGFNVQSPEPEPHEQFAQAWMKAAEPASDAPRQALSLNRPRQWSDLTEPERPPWWTQDQPTPPWLSTPPAETGDEGTSGSALQQPPRARVVAASARGLLGHAISEAALLAAQAGPVIAEAGRKIASGVDSAAESIGRHGTEIAALLNPMHAPRLLTDPADWGARKTSLGNDLHFVERQDGTSSIRRSDGGFLGTGIGESTATLPVDARVVTRPDGTREHAVDWDGLRARIGYDKTLEAMRRLPPGMGGPDKEPGDPLPPDNKPAIPIPPDYFSRRLLRQYPDLIERDTDHLAREGFEPNDAERQHRDACRDLQKQRGEQPPNGTYSGSDAVDTPFGPVAPDMGGPAANERPENKSHEAGIMGETEMARRLYNLGLGYLIPYYGNPPGVNGPDGIAVSKMHRGMMLLESKYSTDPRAVGPAEALIPRPNLKLVDKRMQLAVQTNRIPADIAEEAMHDLMKGNFTQCIGGTGNAHNGYAAHFRDGELVSVSRIK